MNAGNQVPQEYTMAAVHIRSGQPEQVGSLSDCLVLAVDLGFAQTSKSCAIAWRNGSGQLQSAGFRFGECIKKVAGLLEGHSRAVLIIEAPLSGMFTSTGNPLGRGDFERRGPGSAGRTPRYWYMGAGAAMCLAAIFFFRRLLAELQQHFDETYPIEIVLYEGFVTFKPEATQHTSDARLLLECFHGNQPGEISSVEVADGQAAVALMDLVAGSDWGLVPPAIVIPRESNS